MQTNLADFIKHTREGEEADAILRSCVHCGFCTATCPTYQLLGDELDGPRGRIYLIKQVLEGKPATQRTQQHLDRCLTCRNCETTCPSGVQYGRLVDIGRKVVELQVGRTPGQQLVRKALSEVLPRKWLFTPLLRTGQAVRGLLPPVLRNKVPARQQAARWPTTVHERKMILLDGCVQPAMSPNINAATARVFDALGVQLLLAPRAGCCGAIRHHLNQHEGALDDMRRNIDAWWPLVEAGAEAIVMTASGCGATVKDYGHLLAHDPAYAARAARISTLTRDLAELLPPFQDRLTALAGAAAARAAATAQAQASASSPQQPLASMPGQLSASSPQQALVEGQVFSSSPAPAQPGRVAWHPPCTLQHGQQIRGKVEAVLAVLGVDVVMCADSHLCCGSAGTYSVLQPELAYRLRDDKLTRLQATGAHSIVSANIGCITHLQSGTALPVQHWIELVDRAIAG